jgi:hypothetical protein
MKALKARRRPRVRLREEARFTGRADRAAGVIRGVKVLGLVSDNGRRYSRQAVEAALPLYEGKSVRANHPRKATDSREVGDVFGWLENVRLERDGLRADLHVLNPRSELAESVFLAAEKNPGLFGLSHNAEGLVRRGTDGIDEVYEIVEVRSVDLVADPATTRGLFEGRKGKPMKRSRSRFTMSDIRAIVEGMARMKRRRRVRDDDEDDGGPSPSREDAVWEDIKALLDDRSMSAEEKVHRISQLVAEMEREDGADGDRDDYEGPGEDAYVDECRRRARDGWTISDNIERHRREAGARALREAVARGRRKTKLNEWRDRHPLPVNGAGMAERILVKGAR